MTPNWLRPLAACTLALAAAAVGAQDFPSRPITMVMPYAAGGPGDVITRIFAESMQRTLGQQILVDNTSGASGTIGSGKVARAKPDGHTLLMIHVSHATNPVLFKSLAYDPVKDFEPIGRATSGPMLIVARSDFPAKDFNEFASHLRANPAKVSLAHAGVGSASHLCGLMMMNALGVRLNEVPYKGAAPALNDLMGGQVDVMCDQTSGTVPSVKGGKIKAYATPGKTRLPSLPAVPALGELGVQGFDINISFGLYAPKGTPRPVVEQLTAALAKSVADADVRKRLEALGIAAVPVEQATPEALAAHLQTEMETLGPLLVKSGAKVN